ncbi:MAG: right-handed parallel beta-helix repeat-containing protein [Parcubacteria group bacterium]
MKKQISKTFFITIIFFGIFGLAESSEAATYYVATNGNDSNSGAQSAPFKTIQKAANIMVAGDTVYIRAGTYVERVTPQHSGAAGNYIAFQNYGSEEVWIESPNLSATDCAICMGGSPATSHIKFKGLKFRNTNWAQIFINGESYAKNNIIFDGVTSNGSMYNYYLVNGVSNVQIINGTMYGNQFGTTIVTSNNILIDNNEVSYSTIDGIYVTDWGSGHPTDITITNNNVHHNSRQGILVTQVDRANVANNHSYYNGATGIQIEAVSSKGSNNLVKNNICEYNGVTYDGETGIWVDDTDNATVENNIVRYNKNGIYVTGSENVIVRKNQIYGNTKYYTLLMYASPQFGVSKHTKIIHNVIYNNAGTGGVLRIGASGDSAWSENSRFFNNIVSDNTNTYEVYRNGGTTNQLNYNDYYTGSFYAYWSALYMSLNSYQTGTSQDLNSFNADPKFVDKANLNFNILSDSPCINAGDFLTRTTGSSIGTVIPVADAKYFHDGYGIAGVSGDTIRVGSNTATITDIDYGANTITVGRSISWNNGDGVSYAYSGSRPDIGAYEYVSADDTTPPVAPTNLSVQ